MANYRKTQLARKGTFVVIFKSNGKLAFPHKWKASAAAAYHILCNVKPADYILYEVAEGTFHTDKIRHEDGKIRGDFRVQGTLSHRTARDIIDRTLARNKS